MPFGTITKLTSSINMDVLGRAFAPPNIDPGRLRAFGGSTNTPPATSTAPETGDGHLVWSATQDAQTVTLESLGVTINWPDDPDNAYAETVRLTHTKRIEQDDNPDNYVDVEVIDSIDFHNTKFSISKFKLDNP